mmetsp:Transcript_31559/g.32042  ORF Transcript_31559/g.32042 Transcript_31559/m.32042 type:complete len:229 (+) Transcript_31559:99-785(+)
MPPFAESQHAIIRFDENSPVLFVKQTDNGKADRSIAASADVWDGVNYSEGPSFFGRILDFNFCCSLDNQVGNNKVEEVNTDSVVVEQNFTSNMQQYQSRVNIEQTIMILKEIQRTKRSPMEKAEEAVNHHREVAEQYVYIKPSDDTTIPTKNDSWQLFDTPFSIQHDEKSYWPYPLSVSSLVYSYLYQTGLGPTLFGVVFSLIIFVLSISIITFPFSLASSTISHQGI